MRQKPPEVEKVSRDAFLSLKKRYEKVLQEPVPPRLQKLVDRLREGESGDKGPNK